MYVLQCELQTASSIRDTFEIFSDPYNLAKITPPWLGFEILTPGLTMRKRAEIDYLFRWLGVPMKWKTEITAYEPPYLFVDEALRSPYKYWRHRHTFTETANGTIVADRVEYELPLGIFGQLAHTLAVRAQLQRIFEYRQRSIAGLLGSAASGAAPPKIERIAG